MEWTKQYTGYYVLFVKIVSKLPHPANALFEQLRGDSSHTGHVFMLKQETVILGYKLHVCTDHTKPVLINETFRKHFSLHHIKKNIGPTVYWDYHTICILWVSIPRPIRAYTLTIFTVVNITHLLLFFPKTHIWLRNSHAYST